MSEETDYLVCRNCDTPCYVFETDDKGNITSAYCQACGADDPAEFRMPDPDERDSE